MCPSQAPDTWLGAAFQPGPTVTAGLRMCLSWDKVDWLNASNSILPRSENVLSVSFLVRVYYQHEQPALILHGVTKEAPPPPHPGHGAGSGAAQGS